MCVCENNFTKKLKKKFDLLEYMKMLQIDFIMIYVIHKITVLLKIT